MFIAGLLAVVMKGAEIVRVARGQVPLAADVQTSGQPQIDRQASDFFEKEVRPILVEHCQSCHGAKKQESNLRLDSPTGLTNGGDSGPVIVANSPEQSLLIEVVRYGGAIKMPPRGKLPEQAIASLEKWVTTGAKGWNAASTTSSASPDDTAKTRGRLVGVTVEATRDHWAFQPIRSPVIPAVKTVARVATPVDAFVLARLEAAGIAPSPLADRRTLLRRATFDLHGLPPTPAEVTAFEEDSEPDAFARVVQRLLDAPRYGERWGRHWLDVARYSDTKGYVRLNENPRFPASWTYRDYVIAAFNSDLPFDKFITEQLAADLLEEDRDPKTDNANPGRLAALGFLTLGPRFLNSPHDIIDDRIDVVTRGLLGLTVSCARCHDHKFDPIPTRDYYSLHGVFASSIEPREPPLILSASQHGSFEKYLTELHQRSRQLDDYLQQQHTALTASFRAKFAEYLVAGQREPVQANFLAVMFLIDASKDLNPVMVQRWARFLERARRQHDPVFAPWRELVQTDSSNTVLKKTFREGEAPAEPRVSSEIPTKHGSAGASPSLSQRAAQLEQTPRVNSLVVAALAKSPPQNLTEAAQIYARLLHEVDQRWQQQLKENPGAIRLDEPEWEELRQSFCGADSPLTIALDDVEEFLFVDATTQLQLHGKQRLVTDWIGSAEAAPHAMALEDARHPTDSRVFIRGNASNPGEVVPRQFLAALTRGERQPFQHGSGRLELARAIASADNPLTARVLVNRVWMHHFGAGLVRTPSDFGLRGERPTHPELLDHLAHRFIASGWSIKSLHREIMLSSTYRQQSSFVRDEATVRRVRRGSPDPAETPDRRSPLPSVLDAEEGEEKGDLRSTVSSGSGDPRRTLDPENTLLWSMNRRRLEWEAMRDALLHVSGQLDLKMSGPAVDLFAAQSSSRRSVYGFIDRQNLPGELRTFDFAPPDVSSPQRHQSTVPQQALFLMNGPFLKQQVKCLAARPEITSQPTLTEQIDAVHRLLFGRQARPAELTLGSEYLSSMADDDPLDASQFFTRWEEYLQVLLLSNEFVFID